MKVNIHPNDAPRSGVSEDEAVLSISHSSAFYHCPSWGQLWRQVPYNNGQPAERDTLSEQPKKAPNINFHKAHALRQRLLSERPIFWARPNHLRAVWDKSPITGLGSRADWLLSERLSDEVRQNLTGSTSLSSEPVNDVSPVLRSEEQLKYRRKIKSADTSLDYFARG